jgi:hypothetical protein
MANAEITGERYIIVGGDPKEKRFYPVFNTAEFDQATVLPVLAKYLDPVPRFEVFNNLQTDNGEPFILIILDENQPRQIVVKTEGKRTDGKTRFYKLGMFGSRKARRCNLSPEPTSTLCTGLEWKRRQKTERGSDSSISARYLLRPL